MIIKVGECRSEDTPWRPDSSGPLTEEQATEKARQIMRVRKSFSSLNFECAKGLITNCPEVKNEGGGGHLSKY